MINETFLNAGVARAAMHCEELLSRFAPEPDFAHEFVRFAGLMGGHTQGLLAELCDNRGLTTDIADPQLVDSVEVLAENGPASTHGFYSMGQDRSGILVSTAIGDLVAQFDRILGGPGDVDAKCTRLPASAARFGQQFFDRIGQALGQVSDGRAIPSAMRGDCAADIAPFDADEQVWTATIMVCLPGVKRAWRVRIAVGQATLGAMVGSRAVSPATGRTIGASGLDGSAIADVELPLRAVLVDVPMSVARLAQIAVGSLIPVAVQRSVPLMIGDTTIAHGTAGELDDRVALELTQTSISETN